MTQELSTVNFAELCPVNEEKGQQWVDARRLHETLGVGRDFSTWIKQRIQKYEFVDGVDF